MPTHKGKGPGEIETETHVELESGKHVSMDVTSDTRMDPRRDGGSAPVPVALERSSVRETRDVALWRAIRAGTDYVSFDRYQSFVDAVMMGRNPGDAYKVEHDRVEDLLSKRGLPFPGVDAYRLVKVATEVFLMTHVGITGFEDFEEDKLYPHARELPERERKVLEMLRSYLIPADTAHEGRQLGGTPTRGHAQAAGGAVHTEEVKAIPYLEMIQDKLRDVPLVKSRKEAPSTVQDAYFILQEKLSRPCLIELLWSYWHEEGMLVQTMNAICRRFQNRRMNGEPDPLASLDIDPLRPLGNILWGYLQDEQNRLSVLRRAYEYDHHYGLTLEGKAVEGLRSADSRSKFLEAFHNLLRRVAVFYKQDDDTTVKADGFPVLNALKEVHFILAQGANNQFGDLPAAARQEMLIQQWILARPEMRGFLGGRVMVPYTESWMDRVDTMKTMLGWTDVSVIHFHDLGVYGEQILLSIRYGGWSAVNDMDSAANWARFFRPEIQSYVHAYRAVTGVDLTAEKVDTTLPSVHLKNRLATQQRRK